MIRNRVEDHVHAAVTSLRPHFPEACACDVCTDDVKVYALNRLQPRYVSSREGNAVTEVTLSRDDLRASIDVVVMEAFKRVGAAPRCGRTPPAAGS